jgi:hypothetical protein
MPLGLKAIKVNSMGALLIARWLQAFIGYVFVLWAISKYQPNEFIHKSMHNQNKYFIS